MTRDPVCGEVLRQDDAVASFEHGERTHYFKHIKCKMLFEREPESYPAVDDPIASFASRDSEPEVRPRLSRRLIFAVSVGGALLCVAVIAFLSNKTKVESGAPAPEPTSALAAVEPSLPPKVNDEPKPGADPIPAAGVPPSQDSRPEKTGEDGASASIGSSATASIKKPGSQERQKRRRRERARPLNAKMYYEQGNRYLMRNKLKSAITSFQKCIELNPEFAKAYGALGFAYARQDRNDLARQTFKTYLERFPAATDADQMLELIHEYDPDRE